MCRYTVFKPELMLPVFYNMYTCQHIYVEKVIGEDFNFHPDELF